MPPAVSSPRRGRRLPSRKPVTPVSALELFRRSMKRKRPGDTLGDHDEKERPTLLSKFRRIPPPRQVCLLQNPMLSLPIGLTELAGPAGAGKTQMALSLCADCVQDIRHQQKAVYILLGGSSRFLQTAARRLRNMLQSRTIPSTNTDASKDPREHSNSVEEVQDSLKRILVHWICNSEELIHLLQKTLPRLLESQPSISLVVLDGIASLFRLLPEQESYGSSNRAIGSNPWHHRAATFFQISATCKKLSSKFDIPFVVVNECTNRISEHERSSTAPLLEPALGLAWSQCVNCSFLLFRDTTANTTVRILQCLKAPHISSEDSLEEFRIDRSGTIPIRPRLHS